ncbi:MAG: alpha/beta hydrolase [Chloroflexi bacterium]|nr:alpha/beta hydrolase [Chloroflexota bacterium]
MTDWAEGEVEANGIALHYHRTGGEKPPLLLLHGITDNGLCWSRVARDLEQDYDLVMPDARGHGRSGGIEHGFSIDLLADDVAAIIRALELDWPLVYGHSMGAITAVVVAARYPDHVRAAVLEDPPLLPVGQGPTDQQQDRVRQWLLDLRQLPRDERIRRGMAANPGWVEDELVPWADAKAEVDLAVLDYFRVPATYPWRDALPRISCPILLITGDPERGAVVTPEVAHEAAGLWQNGQVAHIAGAGHTIHRDRYEETMAAVRAFLAAHL